MMGSKRIQIAGRRFHNYLQPLDLGLSVETSLAHQMRVAHAAPFQSGICSGQRIAATHAVSTDPVMLTLPIRRLTVCTFCCHSVPDACVGPVIDSIDLREAQRARWR